MVRLRHLFGELEKEWRNPALRVLPDGHVAHGDRRIPALCGPPSQAWSVSRLSHAICFIQT